ncbi:hypothetical protein HDC94_000373 [Leifsonia sp. AK011]|uniref:hypothetical protein n=1 Tax=Leifsonia sp. AK011 TaxID=2723075 RepID=UPI0015CC882A|nr:hypothetical protein [Leifsonia sp. AK011]NYF09217.1 hypothetical protein [Leifsonia sp. AK011]
MMDKHKQPQTYPVMDGAQSAPRADQVAGIVQRVWAESRVYHSDVEPMLRQWLEAVHVSVEAKEFDALLTKARGEFARVATPSDTDTNPHCPAGTLVECLYWDVQTLERGGTLQA